MTTMELLGHIDPAVLNYQDWLSVGMALHHEGSTAEIWEQWSLPDKDRYHAGECQHKWASFRGNGQPVTIATVVEIARKHGYQPAYAQDGGHALDWSDVISRDDDYHVVDAHWVEPVEVRLIGDWNPVQQITDYLTTLFESNDHIGYVTESWERDGQHIPTQGAWSRTARQLLAELGKCNGDVGKVFGDTKQEVGAWVRFNPLDGQGIRDANVTAFRYALVESDVMTIDQQRGVYEQLELPIAALVHSGNKSLHAIVRIDAADIDEYRKRVDFLYKVCKKNGLEIDRQNRNPSRLSRLPGFERNDSKQFLVATNVGRASWGEWKEWIDSVNDDLPNPETLADSWGNLPELALPLIDGILRQGHKMLVSGSSKAGKSFLLIYLCIAIAEGKMWLGHKCNRGKVLYINLELDHASCLHRFYDVYTDLGWASKHTAKGWTPEHSTNIDIWNLRGKAMPLDRLVPKLIRRALKKRYTAIIIDPIYKVITGDENAADKMAYFCNQFDRVCHELGAAVIYCHHHSKGYQGGKRSADRASGSGVFARDPDAILDLIELVVDEDLRKQQENDAVCNLVSKRLTDMVGDWQDHLDCDDDMCSEVKMRALGARLLGDRWIPKVLPDIVQTRREVGRRSAWRVDGTLREFPKLPPINCWFDHPVHSLDHLGVLVDADPEGAEPPWKQGMKARASSSADHKQSRKKSVDTAFELFKDDGSVKLNDIAGYIERSLRTAREWVVEAGYNIKNSIVEAN